MLFVQVISLNLWLVNFRDVCMCLFECQNQKFVWYFHLQIGAHLIFGCTKPSMPYMPWHLVHELSYTMVYGFKMLICYGQERGTCKKFMHQKHIYPNLIFLITEDLSTEACDVCAVLHSTTMVRDASMRLIMHFLSLIFINLKKMLLL